MHPTLRVQPILSTAATPGFPKTLSLQKPRLRIGRLLYRFEPVYSPMPARSRSPACGVIGSCIEDFSSTERAAHLLDDGNDRPYYKALRHQADEASRVW